MKKLTHLRQEASIQLKDGKNHISVSKERIGFLLKKRRMKVGVLQKRAADLPLQSSRREE